MGENKLKVRHISAKETATEDNRNALANEVVIGRNGHYLLFDDTNKAIKNLTKHWFIPDGTYAHDSKYVLQWNNTDKKFSLVAESTGGGGGSNSLPVPASPGNWYLASSGSGDSMTFTWAAVTDNDTTYNAGAGIALNANKFSVDIASDSGLTFSAFDNNNVPTDSSKLKLATMTKSNLGGAKLSVIRNNNVAWTTLNIYGSHDGNNYNQLEIGTNSSSQLYASIPKKYVIPQIPTVVNSNTNDNITEYKSYLLNVGSDGSKSWQEYVAPSLGNTYELMTTDTDGLGKLGVGGVDNLSTSGWESVSQLESKTYPVSRNQSGNLGVRLPNFLTSYTPERPIAFTLEHEDFNLSKGKHVSGIGINAGLVDGSDNIPVIRGVGLDQTIWEIEKFNFIGFTLNRQFSYKTKVEFDFSACCSNVSPGHTTIIEVYVTSGSEFVFDAILSQTRITYTETPIMHRYSTTFIIPEETQVNELYFQCISRCVTGNTVDTLYIDPSSISVVLTKVD